MIHTLFLTTNEVRHTLAAVNEVRNSVPIPYDEYRLAKVEALTVAEMLLKEALENDKVESVASNPYLPNWIKKVDDE